MKRIRITLFAFIFILVCFQSTGQNNVPNFSKFQEVPIKSIKPEGWLKDWLVTQKNGLTGHIEAAGMPFTQYGYGKPATKTDTWWPYEMTANWLEGAMQCAWLLNDSLLTSKYRSVIQYELKNHLNPDGFIGPEFLREKGKENLWPYSIFNICMVNEYLATKDNELLATIKKHLLQPDYTGSLSEMSNIEALLNLYNVTGDEALFKKAGETFQSFLKDTTVQKFTKGNPIYYHGYFYNVAAKFGAMMYMYTGNKDYLRYSEGAYEIIDKYYMMVDGVNVSTEHLRMPVHSLQSHETCDITNFNWSVGYVLMATGDARYADKIERTVFNATPGCVTNDFKALQYFSCPNQVIAAVNSNHNYFYKGDEKMAFAPSPNAGTECCTANVNRIMPDFAARMWMQTPQGGVAAVMYAPSEFTGKVGKNQEVQIVEQTTYPFSDEIEFEIVTKKPATFPFVVRIPGWSVNPEVYLNGRKCENVKPGTFYTLKNNFKNHDKIKLVFPAKLKYQKWIDGGISLERGPLVFSLKIKEERRIRIPNAINPHSNDEFPAYEFYPASAWNYGLCIDTLDLDKTVKFVRTESAAQNPWETPQMKLIIPAKKVSDWKLDVEDTGTKREQFGNKEFEIYVNGEFIFTPPLPSPENIEKAKANPTENIELVPYGCAKLRVTIFPLVK